MTEIEPGVFVGGQIAPEEVAGLGMARIVNNRPDGEERGQPIGAAIAAAAGAAGIDYVDAPVAGGLTREAVEAMAAALTDPPGPVLAYCKSGYRSAALWAAARASQGADPAELIAGAAKAGHDLRGMMSLLRSLAPPLT